MGVKEMGRRSSHQGMPMSFTLLSSYQMVRRRLAGITFSYNIFFDERVSNNEVVVYVFNFGPNTVYFWDLHITIERAIK